MEERQAAYILKKQGVSNREISLILKKSERTISTWGKEDNWEEKISDEAMFQETASGQIRKLITYQLKVLNMIAEKHDENLDDSLTIKELQDKLISKGEGDAINKLYINIRGKELDLENTIRLVMEVLNYVKQEDLDTAKRLIPHINEFINMKRKTL